MDLNVATRARCFPLSSVSLAYNLAVDLILKAFVAIQVYCVWYVPCLFSRLGRVNVQVAKLHRQLDGDQSLGTMTKHVVGSQRTLGRVFSQIWSLLGVQGQAKIAWGASNRRSQSRRSTPYFLDDIALYSVVWQP